MLYVLKQCGETFCTKMNKMLYYIDFLAYREQGMAMTGLTYRAIDFGPVPEHWDRVYSQFDEICQEPRTIGEYEGNVLNSSKEPDLNLFSDKERALLPTVCSHFKSASSRELSTLSHKEKGWMEAYNTHGRIPFADAFALKAL